MYIEYGRIYKLKKKNSQQICPMSANEWGRGGGSCPLMNGEGVQPPNRMKLSLLLVK